MNYQPNQAGALDDTIFLQETANQSNEDFVQALYRKFLLRDVDVLMDVSAEKIKNSV
jgi:hypothetical protein